MDELQRIAEILRPLWPGLVQVATGKNELILRQLTTCVRVELADDLWEAKVFHGVVLLSVQSWRDPDNAAALLEQQAEDVGGLAQDLSAALGLEVSDG